MANPAGGTIHSNANGNLGMEAGSTRGFGTSVRERFAREMATVVETYAPLTARILMSQIFLASGIMKIVDWAGTEAHMASRGMFWIPFFHVMAILVELGAGACLLVGNKTRLAAMVLILFLIPVTLTFHNFWTYADPKEQQTNMIMFMHNLTLMGGLMLLMVHGSGPISVDGKHECR